MKYSLAGYKPTPNDTPYNKFGDVRQGLVKLGASYDSEYRIPELTPVSDQLTLSSCVANATADSLEILLGVEKQQVTQLSRLFVYWNARMYTNDTDKDQGSYIHNAFDSITRLGVCPEDEWKYDTSKVFAQPPIECYKTANDNTISSFYRIDSQDEQRLQDVEAAVRANHPVVFATQIGQEWENNYSSSAVFGPPAKSLGGHAMIIVGVRRNPDLQFYIRNSWNTGWGDNGHGWMNANYILWSETSDLWVPTRIENLLI